MDCSGNGSVGRFGRERLLGSRSARSLLLAPSIGRDRFQLFAAHGESREANSRRSPAPCSRPRTRRARCRLGPTVAAPGRLGRVAAAREGGCGRDRGPPANVRMETSDMALEHEPQRPLKDTNPMSWSQEPRGKGLNPELGSGHLGRRSRESPGRCPRRRCGGGRVKSRGETARAPVSGAGPGERRGRRFAAPALLRNVRWSAARGGASYRKVIVASTHALLSSLEEGFRVTI